MFFLYGSKQLCITILLFLSRIGIEDEPDTGVGLILCKEFTDKHKGEIWLESKRSDLI